MVEKRNKSGKITSGAQELERMVASEESAPRGKFVRTDQIRVFGIVAHGERPRAVKLSRKLSKWLGRKAGREVLATPDATPEAIVRSADFIISVGGDGTILGLAKFMTERAVPVFGINMGRLGFLTGALPKEAEQSLDEILSQPSFEVEERLMLRARISRNGNYENQVFQALNDMVINREGLTRYLKVEVSIGGVTYSHFFGDGVIVATPTGSTAYSMSAGGPVVLPALSNIIITPICPHASALRSIVVPDNQLISVRVFSDRKTDRALLTADGGSNFELEWGDTVECTRSPVCLPIVKSSRRKYFDVLRDKFKIPLESQKRL